MRKYELKNNTICVKIQNVLEDEMIKVRKKLVKWFDGDVEVIDGLPDAISLSKIYKSVLDGMEIDIKQKMRCE